MKIFGKVRYPPDRNKFYGKVKEPISIAQEEILIVSSILFALCSNSLHCSNGSYHFFLKVYPFEVNFKDFEVTKGISSDFF